MRPESHTARAYLKADGIVKAFEGWVANERQSGRCYYKPETVCRRLAQALSMQITAPFLRASAVEPLKSVVDSLGELPGRLICGGIKINTKTGKATPCSKLLFLCLWKFIVLWGFVFWQFLKLTVNGASKGCAATLVYGVPNADLRVDGSTDRFEKFCQFGPIGVLSSSNKLFVQSQIQLQNRQTSKFTYSRYPLFSIFSENKLEPSDAVLSLWSHFASIFEYASQVWGRPINCLLWRDYAEHAVAESLNRRSLISTIIITNTNWLQQFMWMNDLHGRNFRVYMALYSLNLSTIEFKCDPIVANHPSIRLLCVDCIWLWDDSYEGVLLSEDVRCNTQVVGPILWYLPENPLTQEVSSTNKKTVCLFDVMPQSKEWLAKCGISGSYYTLETCKSFLNDIVSALAEVSQKSGLEIDIVLKHKRAPSLIHDHSYFDYVDELVKKHENFRTIDEDVNLFSLISLSDLIVVIPYSSPAAIGRHLGIDSIFYDPTEDIRWPTVGYKTEMFVSGRSALGDVASRILCG